MMMDIESTNENNNKTNNNNYIIENGNSISKELVDSIRSIVTSPTVAVELLDAILPKEEDIINNDIHNNIHNNNNNNNNNNNKQSISILSICEAFTRSQLLGSLSSSSKRKLEQSKIMLKKIQQTTLLPTTLKEEDEQCVLEYSPFISTELAERTMSILLGIHNNNNNNNNVLEGSKLIGRLWVAIQNEMSDDFFSRLFKPTKYKGKGPLFGLVVLFLSLFSKELSFVSDEAFYERDTTTTNNNNNNNNNSYTIGPKKAIEIVSFLSSLLQHLAWKDSQMADMLVAAKASSAGWKDAKRISSKRKKKNDSVSSSSSSSSSYTLLSQETTAYVPVVVDKVTLLCLAATLYNQLRERDNRRSFPWKDNNNNTQWRLGSMTSIPSADISSAFASLLTTREEEATTTITTSSQQQQEEETVQDTQDAHASAAFSAATAMASLSRSAGASAVLRGSRGPRASPPSILNATVSSSSSVVDDASSYFNTMHDDISNIELPCLSLLEASLYILYNPKKKRTKNNTISPLVVHWSSLRAGLVLRLLPTSIPFNVRLTLLGKQVDNEKKLLQARHQVRIYL